MKNIRHLIRIAALAVAFPAAAFAQVATISNTDISTAGINLVSSSVTAPSTTIYVGNDGRTRLVVKTGGTGTTATVRSNGSQVCAAGYACYVPTDVAVTVPANATMEIGPFNRSQFNIWGFDTVKVDFSSIATVSVTALHENRQ